MLNLLILQRLKTKIQGKVKKIIHKIIVKFKEVIKSSTTEYCIYLIKLGDLGFA